MSSRTAGRLVRGPGPAPEVAGTDREIVPPNEERTLVQLAQRGDRAAFEALVRRYDRTVLRLACRIVGSEEDARDIYQESFLKAYRSLGAFRLDSRFETWLFRIVSNVCLDHLRRAAARPEDPAPGDGQDARGDGPEALVDDRPDHDPERLLERRLIGRRIAVALERLTPRERLVFALRHDEGLRMQAIAEILDTSEETARNCLYRAHGALRAMLSDLHRAPRAGAVGRADGAEAGS